MYDYFYFSWLEFSHESRLPMEVFVFHFSFQPKMTRREATMRFELAQEKRASLSLVAPNAMKLDKPTRLGFVASLAAK